MTTDTLRRVNAGIERTADEHARQIDINSELLRTVDVLTKQRDEILADNGRRLDDHERLTRERADLRAQLAALTKERDELRALAIRLAESIEFDDADSPELSEILSDIRKEARRLGLMGGDHG